MQFLRSAAIDARVRFTASRRKQQLSELCDEGNAPMFVAFYHRVADSHPNDWSISKAEFRRHIDYCRENFQMIGLDELQRRVSAGRNTEPTITFTFDDGYAENSDFALPVLAELEFPCVYFVTVGNVRDQKPFPHDVACGQPLPVNTVGQLLDAAASGIEIGLHTESHVDFSKHDDPETIRREIFDAKDELEQMLGQQVRYFAVPFGLPPQLTPNVVAAAHQAGLAGVCSAYGAYNFPSQDVFHIRRFHGDPDFARFRNWLTYDTRKLKNQPVVAPFPSDMAIPFSSAISMTE